MILQLLAALVPIALLIIFGWWLRQSKFLTDAFWPQAERLGYFILLPSLLLHGLATAQLDNVPIAGMVATLVLSILVIATILAVTRPAMLVDNPSFTSIFQGGIRFNNYVGVSAAASLFGSQGIALAAVANASIVPTVNVLCVLMFARYSSIGKPSIRNILWQLVSNPLIIGCSIGIFLYVTGLGLPTAIEPVLKALGQASLPIGLLCVGAALDFSSIRSWIKPVAISSFAKFVLLPLVTLVFCLIFNLTGQAAIIALMFQALPTASSSYIMARQLGGDAPLMAGIIAGQTILASLALPIVVLSLSGLL